MWNLDRRDVLLIILTICVIYLLRKDNQKEHMTSEPTPAIQPISEYATDMEAIKQLGDLAKQIYTDGKLIIPSDVEMNGKLIISSDALIKGNLQTNGNISTSSEVIANKGLKLNDTKINGMRPVLYTEKLEARPILRSNLCFDFGSKNNTQCSNEWSVVRLNPR